MQRQRPEWSNGHSATSPAVGRLTYPASQIGFGLEQPVWNPKNDRFYEAVPAVMNINIGSIDIINPLTMQVETSLMTTCPAGLVLTPSQRLMTSCGQAFDAITGNNLGVTGDVTADQLWYNLNYA